MRIPFHGQTIITRFLYNDSTRVKRQTSEDLRTAKMLSATFEPTPSETDFDSVVATTRLRQVTWTSEETIHESTLRCVLI
jgi:hypothetical protein